MSDCHDIATNTDEFPNKAPIPITLAELRALSQSERDFLKLVQEVISENTARLTAPTGAQVRERTLKDVVE